MRPLLIAAIVALFPWLALGHGDAQWIMNSQYSACCGPQDCQWLPPGDVEMRPSGFWVNSRQRLFTFDEALPNLDPQGHHFWLCVYLDKDKGFAESPIRTMAIQINGVWRWKPCFFANQVRM